MKKTLQGATELTEIHGEIFGDIIWRLQNSASHCRVTFSLINTPKKWRIFDAPKKWRIFDTPKKWRIFDAPKKWCIFDLLNYVLMKRQM